jgi:hypothetical protein
MSQNDDYKGNYQMLYNKDLQQQLLKDQYVVEENDRINVLTYSTTKGPAKMKQKQNLLTNLHTSRNTIISAAKQLVAAYNTGVESVFECIIPETKRIS